ncbi:hypothetical protein [Paenibacillus macerans]|uniref:Uncharacterized protein n=1 Tax=Paenibacillus macerans TaxID=44252 RepID=A0A090Y2Q6_PAEMA|nr:hypothetical protein [Paenibacillus macerans]KFM93023.1 hypothetical protein DJ90_2987 [Paenibacillus macerans]MCY7561588.1 hypothetical protein [Paenibacillus macerans]MEC0153313.1 hypothetical protein [Paenibacillus macerans]SUA84833.1 Uncharacterised protein [Paenibacillus macerans]
MKVTITKIEMPTASNWGIVQINNLENTFFRFDVRNGKPVLDVSLFVCNVQDPNERQEKLGSELHQSIQEALDDHFKDMT